MKITIIGRQMNVRDDLKDLVEKKLRKFDKFFDDNAEAYVTFSRKRNLETIEVTVASGGTIFRSEEDNSTFNNALDAAVESLERQIRKNKTRLEKRLRSGAFADSADAMKVDEEVVFEIRTKTFPFKPMSTEEAILQMNLSDHQFFVFVNSEIDATCVVYKKKDGTYGLLMPE